MLSWPPGGFAYSANNLPATPSATARGTTITASGSTNTKGSVTQLLAAQTFDIEQVEIAITGTLVADTDSSSLLDIVGDPSGGTSWVTSAQGILIPDLLAGWAETLAATSRSLGRTYHFPLKIPAGTSIGARMQSAIASQTVDVSITVRGGHRTPFWSGNKITTIGADTGNSRGTLVTPGASGTYGSWTNIDGTTARDLRSLVVKAAGTPTSVPATARTYYVQVGIGSVQIGPTYVFNVTTAEASSDLSPRDPVHFEVPEGVHLQARATSSNTAFPIDVVIYGIS